MRKLFTVAAAGIAVLGWSTQGIANPDPHPTTAPHDDHKDDHHEGERKGGEHKDEGHKEEHKQAH